MANYSEKLRNPKWQKKRLEILKRDKFKCKLCGGEENELHVHHKSYEAGREPWEYDNDNFITYCKYCHEIVEALKKEKRTIVKSVRTGEALATILDDDPNRVLVISKVNGELIAIYLSERTCKSILKLLKPSKKTI